MKKLIQNKDRAYIFAVFAVALALGFAMWAMVSKHENGSWLKTAFERNVRKIGLVNAIRANLLLSAEEEKSSVMADTDEASQAFAEQSERSSAGVEQARRELLALIEATDGRAELKSMQDFSDCWEKLRLMDREVLSLAVQNTNVKAMRLSFGPAGEAFGKMESALNRLMDASAASPDAPAITENASRVLINALKIRTLQAQHIAEQSDLKMNELEATMKLHDEQAEQALDTLRGLAGNPGGSLVDEAAKAYEEFRKTNAEVIALSRQNSNIRSFAISLGQKRKLTAQCLDSLAALEKTVQEGMEFKATR